MCCCCGDDCGLPPPREGEELRRRPLHHCPCHHSCHCRRPGLRHPHLRPPPQPGQDQRRGRVPHPLRPCDHAHDGARLQPHAGAGRPQLQEELAHRHQVRRAAAGRVQLRRPAVRARAGRRRGREAERQQGGGVPPLVGLRVRGQGRGAGQRRRGRVQEAERHGGVRGGGGGHRQVPVHAAVDQVQGRGHLPPQAAARDAGDDGRRVPEGRLQDRQIRRQEVLEVVPCGVAVVWFYCYARI
ncbi:hypothetical protein BS78_02G112900 [Paspalum vaginatum]|nr:hypothetical protein BS78_02G112900 [Paspalum vaginatum]